LRRCCDGQSKASSSNQLDHSFPPFFEVSTLSEQNRVPDGAPSRLFNARDWVRVAYGRLFVWLRPILMVRRIFQVAFLALTLNTRRDDRYSTADERAALGPCPPQPDLGTFVSRVDRGKRRPTLFNARTKCELRTGAYLFWSHRRLNEQKAQAAAQAPTRQHQKRSGIQPISAIGVGQAIRAYIRSVVGEFAKRYPGVRREDFLHRAIELANAAEKTFEPELGFKFSTHLAGFARIGRFKGFDPVQQCEEPSLNRPKAVRTKFSDAA
jgi:hypothetical protein